MLDTPWAAPANAAARKRPTPPSDFSGASRRAPADGRHARSRRTQETEMLTRKLTNPLALAAAAALAVGGGTYAPAGVLEAPAAAAAQLKGAAPRATSTPKRATARAPVRPSPAAVGLARDLGITSA